MKRLWLELFYLLEQLGQSFLNNCVDMPGFVYLLIFIDIKDLSYYSGIFYNITLEMILFSLMSEQENHFESYLLLW